MTNTMFAWQLEKLGGKLDFIKRPIPEPRAGSALVNIESVLLLGMQGNDIEVGFVTSDPVMARSALSSVASAS